MGARTTSVSPLRMSVVFGHPNTDFDALAGMLAAQLLYPGSLICLHGGMNRNVREFFNLYADQIPHIEPSGLRRGSVGRAILIEIGTLGRLGELRSAVESGGVEVIAFEHDPGGADTDSGEDRPGDRRVVSIDGSLITEMLRLIIDRDIRLTPMHATAFALGIHEDTGSLTYPSTTQRDAEALAYVLGEGASREMIARYLGGTLTESRRKLLTKLQAAARIVDIAGFRVVVAATTVEEHVEDVSGLVSRVGEMADWDAIFMCVGMGARTQIVARSRTAGLRADDVVRAFGGGGHPEAAAANVHDGRAEAILERVVDCARALANPAPGAGELMSSPIKAVAVDRTIDEALVDLRRWGFAGAPVESTGDYVGVVMREDLERARVHGLGHAPVKGVMSTGVALVAGTTPLAVLRDALASGRAHRLLVTESGHLRVAETVPIGDVAGVVTPKDVLSAMSAPVTERRGGARDRASRELRDAFARIPKLTAVLPAIQRAAADEQGVYLVGGAVRDVLLGEEGLDVDLVVEGDPLDFAKRLADDLGGRYRPHERFRTAAIRGAVVEGTETDIDVAGARSEYYTSPAALPEVERSTLRRDLSRRDFTINAMAASLMPDDFGTVVDFFDGYRDLRAGVLRVLHNLSFVEDPTRIFRAVRYEARLSFEMDGRTLSLARGCVGMHLVANVTPSRLRGELLAILGEERIGPILRRMDELELAAALEPGLRSDGQTVATVARADSTIRNKTWAKGLRRDLVRLAIMARDIPVERLLEWMVELKLRKADRELVAASACAGRRVADLLRARLGAKPSEVNRILAGEPLESAVSAAAFADDPRVERVVSDWAENLRSVRLEITGADLAGAGVPESRALGRALEATLDLKIDGKVTGRDEELAAAVAFATGFREEIT